MLGFWRRIFVVLFCICLFSFMQCVWPVNRVSVSCNHQETWRPTGLSTGGMGQRLAAWTAIMRNRSQHNHLVPGFPPVENGGEFAHEKNYPVLSLEPGKKASFFELRKMARTGP